MGKHLKVSEIKGDSIEKVFCIPLEKGEIRPMTKDESEVMITGMFNTSKETIAELEIRIPAKEIPFGLKVMLARGKMYSYTFNIPALLMISAICSNLGSITMYLTYIQYWCKKNNVSHYTLDEFGQMFPLGVFTERALEAAWDSQKVRRDTSTSTSDNLLDHFEALESLKF